MGKLECTRGQADIVAALCRRACGHRNFDDRSFDTNDEITLGIRDEAVAEQLDAVFGKYVARCQEIELKTWQQRSLWHKFKDKLFYVFNEVL